MATNVKDVAEGAAQAYVHWTGGVMLWALADFDGAVPGRCGRTSWLPAG
jgi:hypothetical protein